MFFYTISYFSDKTITVLETKMDESVFLKNYFKTFDTNDEDNWKFFYDQDNYLDAWENFICPQLFDTYDLALTSALLKKCQVNCYNCGKFLFHAEKEIVLDHQHACENCNKNKDIL